MRGAFLPRLIGIWPCFYPSLISVSRQVCDLGSEDLLSHLPSVITFLGTRTAGAALVHSKHGTSRSAAVVMAALMHKYKYCLEKCFQLLKSKRECVQPNPGFMAQLRLWEAMRFKLEPDFLRYKMYKLEKVSENFRKSKIISQEVVRAVLEPEPTNSRKSSIVYKCKACRRVLATCHNLIPHQAGHCSQSGSHCSQSVSITPMAWMEESLQRSLAGKLFCPHCR